MARGRRVLQAPPMLCLRFARVLGFAPLLGLAGCAGATSDVTATDTDESSGAITLGGAPCAPDPSAREVPFEVMLPRGEVRLTARLEVVESETVLHERIPDGLAGVVDFERDVLVLVDAGSSWDARVVWVAETDDALVVAVDVEVCSGAPPPPGQLAVRVARPRGAVVLRRCTHGVCAGDLP